MKINAEMIERARIIRGWSKGRLAKEVGVDQSTIGRIERGLHKKPETIKKCADVLGLRMEDLLQGTAA